MKLSNELSNASGITSIYTVDTGHCDGLYPTFVFFNGTELYLAGNFLSGEPADEVRPLNENEELSPTLDVIATLPGGRVRYRLPQFGHRRALDVNTASGWSPVGVSIITGGTVVRLSQSADGWVGKLVRLKPDVLELDEDWGVNDRVVQISGGQERPDLPTILAAVAEIRENNMSLVGIQTGAEPIDWFRAGGETIEQIVTRVRTAVGGRLIDEGTGMAATFVTGKSLEDRQYELLSGAVAVASRAVAKVAYELPHKIAAPRPGDVEGESADRYAVGVGAMNVLLGLVEWSLFKAGLSPLRR